MFDWREFLRLADDLAESRDDEASVRSAISRAYYAAYHDAQQRADELGLETAPAECQSDHQACWGVFADQRDRSLRGIGTTGKRLRDLRNRADYEPPTITERELKLALTWARKIINELALAAASHH